MAREARASIRFDVDIERPLAVLRCFADFLEAFRAFAVEAERTASTVEGLRVRLEQIADAAADLEEEETES